MTINEERRETEGPWARSPVVSGVMSCPLDSQAPGWSLKLRYAIVEPVVYPLGLGSAPSTTPHADSASLWLLLAAHPRSLPASPASQLNFLSTPNLHCGLTCPWLAHKISTQHLRYSWKPRSASSWSCHSISLLFKSIILWSAVIPKF